MSFAKDSTGARWELRLKVSRPIVLPKGLPIVLPKVLQMVLPMVVPLVLNQVCSSFEESKSFEFDGRLDVLVVAEVL